MSNTDYTLIPDIIAAVTTIAPDTIVSRTIYVGDTMRIILFGFAAGQELSEHTSTKEAVLHFLRGEATVVLGGEPTTAGPGTLVRMAPNLKHSIVAQTETLMLLTMYGG
jgi:quercetin dioxygenase-like cupin family protein